MKVTPIFLRASAIATVILIVLVVFSYHVTTSDNVQKVNVGSSTFFTASSKELVQIIDGYRISNLSGNDSKYLEIKVNLSLTQIAGDNFGKTIFNLVNHTMYNGNIFSQTVDLSPGFYMGNMTLRIYLNLTYASSFVGNASAVIVGEGNSFSYAIYGLIGSTSLMAVAIYSNLRRR